MHLKKKALVAVLLLFQLSLSGCLSSSQQQDSKTCKELEEICETHEGYSYVWGSASSENGGFDCSGFVYSVFKQMEKPLPRTTSIKYWLMFDSKVVDWKDGKCGYLVWWSKNRPYGHIGILLEPPVFWQSGTSTGPVGRSFEKDTYWLEDFVGAKKTGLL